MCVCFVGHKNIAMGCTNHAHENLNSDEVSNITWLYSEGPTIKATSYTRLRAPNHYTSSTLIGGKDGAGPSSLHTTLEGPTEYVNAR